MNKLIRLSKIQNDWKSLGTVKPKELVKLEIVEDKRDWDPKFQEQLRQLNLFEAKDNSSRQEGFEVVRKLPYKYYYHFLTEGDNQPRRMMIEDWEIGALYWKCLAMAEGDEAAANEKVREKYETEFFEKDIYLFVGTTLAHHMTAPNPFMIIGVFYPPHKPQMALQLGW